MDLSMGWELRFEGLNVSVEDWPLVERRSTGWFPCALPCDVRQPLIAHGVIPEPLEAMNCLQSEWVEDRSWWFRKRFTADPGLLEAVECRLRFEMLDVEADVVLNGRRVGHQKSAFYPFETDVKELLLPGENTLGVRLTCGLERVKDADFAGYSRCIATEEKASGGPRGDRRRVALRKPQYVFGWDWGPRVATCAIAGSASLTTTGAVRAASLHAVTASIEDGAARLAVCVEAENTHPFSTVESHVTVTVREWGGEGATAAMAETDVLLRSGINHVDFTVTVAHAKLWWPNGCGEQPLYTLEATVAHAGGAAESAGASAATGGKAAAVGGAAADTCVTRIGIRTLSLDQTPEMDGRRFALVVNGVRVHCKGANWVPADSLYARVINEKYRTLVREAAAAHFTMLRVWGGGRYESDAFYDACDEAGILIWHDFMFACALYPDNEPWFQEEVRREADYQTRRLRTHPCMAVWCGSNENNWGFDEWWIGSRRATHFFGGARSYNYILPLSVRANCPEIPYWNGSPYGGVHPNGNDAGDCHYWGEAMMSKDMARRVCPEQYDRVQARFVSEYGYVGPCVKSSIVRYHGGEPVDRAGPVYQMHNNTFEKETVLAGIREHYRDPEGLSFDDYLLYASLVQGLMYGYSLESLRSNPRNGGSLFWMYADCWGEVGWTVIDYYLKRKPSYYFVRRAFWPRKLVLRERDGVVEVTGINDTAHGFSFQAEYGWIRFDGAGESPRRAQLSLPAHSRGIVLRFDARAGDANRGLDFMRPIDAGEVLLPATLYRARHRARALPDPGLQATRPSRASGRVEYTVRARAFAHAVHFNLGDDVRLSDEYFDLLPGESRTITAEGDAAGIDTVAPVSVR